MSITETIRAKMYEAMKEKDKEKKDVYAYALGELEKTRKGMQTAANPNPVLTEADEVAVIAKLTKQSKDAITEASKKPADTPDKKAAFDKFVAERNMEIALYSEFLPKQMSADEIAEVIKEVVAELPVPVNKGILMKNLMPRVKGKADGKLVSQMVEEYLRNC